MKLLVTHRSPDLDAIGALWMFKRFDAQTYDDAKFAFVNAGDSIDIRVASDMGFSLEHITHVDTGLGDFDHHQPERGKKRICATSLVYEYVSHMHKELQSDEALQFLVEYVTGIDHFEEQSWPEANNLQYQLMIHNLIDGFRQAGSTDDEVTVRFGFELLDAAYAGLSQQIEAEHELENKKIEFDTQWGKAVGIESKNDDTVKVAQKSGYVIAVRKDPDRGNVRIKAIPGKNIDLTAIYKKITAIDTDGYWYFHPAKTMVLNGSSKDDSGRKSSPLSLQQVIDLFTE